MVELLVSKQNYIASIKKERNFLITDNTEISIQKGDRIKHVEANIFGESCVCTGRWFVAVVKFVTNRDQKENYVVYQFEIERTEEAPPMTRNRS